MTCGISMLMGAGEPRVSLSNQIVSADNVDPGDAIAAYSLDADGDVTTGINGVLTDVGDWLAPKILMSSYECFATVNSGAVSGGTTGSWIGLEIDRLWTRTQTTVGVSGVNLTIQIRKKLTTLVLASCTVQLNAEVT